MHHTVTYTSEKAPFICSNKYADFYPIKKYHVCFIINSSVTQIPYHSFYVVLFFNYFVIENALPYIRILLKNCNITRMNIFIALKKNPLISELKYCAKPVGISMKTTGFHLFELPIEWRSKRQY